MRNFFNLYIDGFKGMGKLGRSLWIIILLKLFIMFAVLKMFFFPNFLKHQFTSDTERSNYIINTITNQHNNDDDSRY